MWASASRRPGRGGDEEFEDHDEAEKKGRSACLRLLHRRRSRSALFSLLALAGLCALRWCLPAQRHAASPPLLGGEAAQGGAVAASAQKLRSALASPPPPRAAAQASSAYPPRRLLLSSHGRLQWVEVGADAGTTGAATVLHEGRGVYYGALPDGEGPHSGRVWVVSRPHNWRQPEEGAREAALLVDTQSGALLREVALPSLFTHDLLRCGDKAYLADTGHGSVWELHASNLSVVRELKLFSVREHVNTLACWPPLSVGAHPSSPPALWAVLHNLGPSKLVEIDLLSGSVARTFSKVGVKSHGLSLWRNSSAVMLSSGEGRLVLVDLAAAAAQGEGYAPEVLWEDPQRTFMKGLTVIEDVAYFGVSAFGTRQERDDVEKTSDLAAFHLHTRQLLWRVTVQTRGLLNIVSAPQLSERSTSVALPTWDMPVPQAPHGVAPGGRQVSDGQRLVSIREGPRGGNWDQDHGSGGAPRLLNLQDKAAAARLRGHELTPSVMGENALMMLRHVDVSELVAAVRAEARLGLWDPELALRHNAVLTGREDNMARFKPGVQTAHLVFSDQTASTCFHFPWWDHWRPVVMPVISQILGWYGIPESEHEQRIVRLQLARMGPGGAILKHSDKGGWATGLHRIHIPLISNPEVHFLMQSDPEGNFMEIPVAEGNVFEINNVIPHQVHNSQAQERVHLLLDFAEAPLSCSRLQPGQKCVYGRRGGGIQC